MHPVDDPGSDLPTVVLEIHARLLHVGRPARAPTEEHRSSLGGSSQHASQSSTPNRSNSVWSTPSSLSWLSSPVHVDRVTVTVFRVTFDRDGVSGNRRRFRQLNPPVGVVRRSFDESQTPYCVRHARSSTGRNTSTATGCTVIWWFAKSIRTFSAGQIGHSVVKTNTSLIVRASEVW